MRRFRMLSPENPGASNDMTAGGAFIVDEPGATTSDRVLFINMMIDSTRIPKSHGFTGILATINGKSWPHTERFTHEVGDTIVWRVLNGSMIPHPMHLHGFYFDVLARGTPMGDSIYDMKQVRKAVTERLLAFSTMTMRWVPERAGNWLFHCHLTAHTQLHGSLGPMKASHPAKHAHDAIYGMSNLMMGVTVRGTPARDPATRRHVRLLVEQGDSIAQEFTPRFRYTLDGASNTKMAGPTIVVHKDQPTAITVVNRTREATAVHWHGIELESFHDGVAGYGGYGARISPLIAPGDSFIARMTPPRAGTFIYHTHVDELRQQRGGLYGARGALQR
jgi:FtsP/CotA-like multicopper oxidase with cupredoxin domain